MLKGREPQEISGLESGLNGSWKPPGQITSCVRHEERAAGHGAGVHEACDTTVNRRRGTIHSDLQSCVCLERRLRRMSRGINSPERHSTAHAARSLSFTFLSPSQAVSSRKAGVMLPLSSAPNTGLAHCEA